MLRELGLITIKPNLSQVFGVIFHFKVFVILSKKDFHSDPKTKIASKIMKRHIFKVLS